MDSEFSPFVYQVQITIGNVSVVTLTRNTEFMVTDIPSYTFVLFVISVQFGETFGPDVIIGQPSGLKLIYIDTCKYIDQKTLRFEVYHSGNKKRSKNAKINISFCKLM